MKKYILISVLAGISQIVNAQQTTAFDHYLVHQYLVNPAAAGLNGTNIFIDYRRQWSGFAGAPETQVLAVDGNVRREQMGLGLMVMNDQVNVTGSTSAMATYSYRIKFDENHFLRFGLSAGLNQNRILFSRIIAEDPNELLLFQNNQNATGFDGSAGIHYLYKNLQIGFAATHLFGGRFYYENNFNASSLNFQNIRHYLANAQYRFDIKKGKWGVMPSVQVRTVQGIPPIYEGGVTGFYKNDAWMTFRYSNKSGYTASAGGVIAKNVMAGYAYTFSANGMTGYNQGTHDIIIGYRIAGGKRASGGLDEKELNELNKKNNELFEKTDYLQKENEALKKELEDQKRMLKEQIYGLDSFKNGNINQEELQKLIDEHMKKYNNMPGGNGNNGNGSAGGKTNADGTEQMVDGKVYIVVGAVTKLDNAKLLQKIVQREYNETTFVVRDDSEFWYFVYTKAFDSREEADKELNRAIALDTKEIFIGKPWPYISKKK